MESPEAFTRAYCATPLGLLEIRGRGSRISHIRFVTSGRRRRSGHPALKKFTGEIRRYFKGTQKTFSASFAPEGTPFQKKVWKALSGIAFGRTASYRDIARRIGNPRAVRAVGGAAGRNPLLIAVPCHRVIARDGKLSGFACGVRRKAWLLRHEQR
ncbi:MAG: methylated-DNA--[protein]-cysteine S-methyltransferase [Candidatus Omnitrophota bacterium]